MQVSDNTNTGPEWASTDSTVRLRLLVLMLVIAALRKKKKEQQKLTSRKKSKYNMHKNKTKPTFPTKAKQF